MYKVYLKPGKEESLKRFHPWVFSGAIAHFDGEPEEGEVVEIYTSKKEFIAKGHFQIGSIAVRVLSFCRDEAIDAGFWKRKLSIAYDMRRSIGIAGNPTNNTYRLVHGEGDNLPGLVIDIYARTAVMQAHSAGMHLDRMAIADALSEVMGDQIDNIYYKSETTLPFKADLYPENGLLYRRVFGLRHARQCHTGTFRRQLGQGHRPDQQKYRIELSRRQPSCSLCRGCL